MDNNSDLAPFNMPMAPAIQELRDCRGLCAQYGLALSEGEILELVGARAAALAATGRIEFGGGILPKLIYAFCDSPYVDSQSWAETLSELQEAFYYYKSESRESFTDDELIEFMARVFNGRAQGSMEYLTGASLEQLCRMARQGRRPRAGEDSGELI